MLVETVIYDSPPPVLGVLFTVALIACSYFLINSSLCVLIYLSASFSCDIASVADDF